ncbi:hypothetical protein AAG570_009326 [Ranatra chinensis]|uniref:folate gamma-glutamyl hydrolase n=1 Tax=Ranatra chinensis TaxID=642074 RepID=A0ABD0YNR8_9HEMI
MDNYTAYLPASYVKAAEGSGARVVPIMIRQSPKYYWKILKQINGLILPGGDSDFHNPDGIAAAASILYKMILQMNESGDRFPVLGVCQGMELLAHLSNERRDILTPCSSHNTNLALKFKPDATNSSLYAHASKQVMHILATMPVTSNHHS